MRDMQTHARLAVEAMERIQARDPDPNPPVAPVRTAESAGLNISDDMVRRGYKGEPVREAESVETICACTHPKRTHDGDGCCHVMGCGCDCYWPKPKPTMEPQELPPLGLTLGDESEQEWSNKIIDRREEQLGLALARAEKAEAEVERLKDRVREIEASR